MVYDVFATFGFLGGLKVFTSRFLSSTLLPFLVWGFLIKTEY